MMKEIVGGIAFVAVAAGLYTVFDKGGAPGVSSDYERSAFYDRCDRDYVQSASHLGFSASSAECECFDEKLQALRPSQQAAAYKTLEDSLTLAFMGKAGAEVSGNNVSFQDGELGEVNATVTPETSGKAIIQSCAMF
ncbi:MAG: hypothetical protein AAGK17_00550 [Pseudomonadota bacterium]